MNLEVLLLPALGGYWFISRAYITKYRLARDSGDRFYLAAALAGACFLLAGRVVEFWLDEYISADLVTWWNSFAPFKYSGTVAISSILAFFSPIIANQCQNEVAAAKKAAWESGDLIECVLQESIEKNSLVEVSLKNDKVYIGWTKTSGVDARDDCDVAVVPAVSGYRTQSRRIKLTTDYLPFLEEFDGNGGFSEDVEQFRVIFPVTDIASVRHFDPQTYERFREQTATS